MNVPNLRFKSFNGPYVETPLEQLAEIGRGKSKHRPRNDSKLFGDVIPFIQTGDVKHSQLYVSSFNEMYSEFGVQQSKIWDEGTLCVTIAANIAETAILKIKACFPDSIIGITVKDNILNVVYLKLLFDNIKNKLSEQSEGVAQSNMNLEKIKKIIFKIPSLKEQMKISSFFLALEKKIKLQQEKIDLLKEQKKGFLQKMFPKIGETQSELRFDGFTKDWKYLKLGLTQTYFTDGNYGESYPSLENMADKNTGIPFLRGSDLKNGYLDVSTANYITKEKHSELKSGHIKKDDIIIAVRGSLGSLGYATEENIGWNINSQLAIIRTDKSELDGRFLIQYFLSSRGQKELLSRNTGTALKQLPIKQLKDVPVPLVSIEEQQKIGFFFKSLDKKIALQQKKLELLLKQKQGFMQQMFI